jgi:hypothetical protein
MGELDYEEDHGINGCNIVGKQCGRLRIVQGMALESRDELHAVSPGGELHGVTLLHDVRGPGQLL